MSRKTPLQLYTSAYAEAIIQWAVRASPSLQVRDLREKLTNKKKKNFLAYHHFDPSLFERLKKWGSVKTHAEKYRSKGQSIFGQDLFCHPSKRCAGLHTDEFYVMPSDNKYNKFEEEIKRAVEEKEKRVNESAKATEKINDVNQQIKEVSHAVITLLSYNESDQDINQAVQEKEKIANEENEKTGKESAKATDKGNDGNEGIMEVADALSCTKFDEEINLTVKRKDQAVQEKEKIANQENEKMGKESPKATDKGNDGNEGIMEVADAVMTLPSCTKFDEEINLTAKKKEKIALGSATENKESMVSKSWIPTNKKNGGDENNLTTNFTIRRGQYKGALICGRALHIKMKQENHLARRVLGAHTTRSYTFNFVEYREVKIYWDSNHKMEWVNESQIGAFVDEEGKGKRCRRTVQEGELAREKRLRAEIAIAEENIMRKKNRFAMKAVVEKLSKLHAETLTKGPNDAMENFARSAAIVVEETTKMHDPASRYMFFSKTREFLSMVRKHQSSGLSGVS
jgi:hypothetical protein